ncbi:MAG: hypothetical protein WCC10_11095 [Tumebacillaceae bacterium]
MWKNRNLLILMPDECIAGLGLWFGMIVVLYFGYRQQRAPISYVDRSYANEKRMRTP